MLRKGSAERIIQNQEENVSIELNALKYLKLTTKCPERNMFKIQSLGRCWYINIAKLRSKKSNKLQKGKLKSLDDL